MIDPNKQLLFLLNDLKCHINSIERMAKGIDNPDEYKATRIMEQVEYLMANIRGTVKTVTDNR